MNAQDYVEWCHLAGLYLMNVSKLDQYRTYQPKISSAGLNIAIVSDFLTDNPTRVDVTNWRTHCVYEMGTQEAERVNMTADALEAIGASRVANAVRIAKSQSPFEAFRNFDFSQPGQLMDVMEQVKIPDMLNHLRENIARNLPDLAASIGLNPATQQAPESDVADSACESSACESRTEIERLLDLYVASHEADLQSDLQRHGDPRTRAGYTREGRDLELELLRQQQSSLAEQLLDAEKLRELTATMQRKIDKAIQSGKQDTLNVESLQRKMLKRVKRGRRRSDSELIPELEATLAEAETLIAAHPEVFQRDPIGDAALSERLAAIGAFEIEIEFGATRVHFDEPAGWNCAWTSFSLSLTYPEQKTQALNGLLPVVERLKSRLPKVCETLAEQLIEGFRNYEGQMHESELDDYEQNEEGEVTVDSILAHVEGGTISLEALDDVGEQICCGAHFAVEWDDEHGFAAQWDDELEEQVVTTGTSSSIGQVNLADVGRVLSPADITQFEQRFSIALPEEYRQFLLQSNGGRPNLSHVVLKNAGMKMPLDIERFFSITGSTAGGDPANSLEGAMATAREQSLPSNVLPIAEVQSINPLGAASPSSLILVLSGKKQGQILWFDSTSFMQAYGAFTKEMLKQLSGQIVEMAMPVAKSLAQLFEKLKAKPHLELPDWLRMIRANDSVGFLGWLAGGGQLKVTHQEYGAMLPLTVIDYLTRDASIEFLEALLQRQAFKPKQLRDSWQRYMMSDIGRYQQLMKVLPRTLWPSVLQSVAVWDHPDLWEQLAEAGVDFNVPINDEGTPPIHLAVNAGKKDAVKWLMAHGADPQQEDKFRRTAFIYAERGPGFDCLCILEGNEDTQQSVGTAASDAPGIAILWDAAQKLPAGVDLRLTIQMKSPAVTRIEKAYGVDCHYLLTFGVRNVSVTFNDMRSARQDYLHAAEWPTFLFAPILQWPEMIPLWETLDVCEFDLQKAIKKRTYQGPKRADLLDAARSALEQAFDPQEAAARGIRLQK